MRGGPGRKHDHSVCRCLPLWQGHRLLSTPGYPTEPWPAHSADDTPLSPHSTSITNPPITPHFLSPPPPWTFFARPLQKSWPTYSRIFPRWTFCTHPTFPTDSGRYRSLSCTRPPPCTPGSAERSIAKHRPSKNSSSRSSRRPVPPSPRASPLSTCCGDAGLAVNPTIS